MDRKLASVAWQALLHRGFLMVPPPVHSSTRSSTSPKARKHAYLTQVIAGPRHSATSQTRSSAGTYNKILLAGSELRLGLHTLSGFWLDYNGGFLVWGIPPMVLPTAELIVALRRKAKHVSSVLGDRNIQCMCTGNASVGFSCRQPCPIIKLCLQSAEPFCQFRKP